MVKISKFKTFSNKENKENKEKTPIWVNGQLSQIFGYILNCSANRLATFFGTLGDENQHLILTANYFKPGDRNDEILFIPTRQLTEAEKTSKVVATFEKSNNPIKVGRLIRKIYSENNPDRDPVTDKEVEHFVNLFKESWERVRGVNQNFKVVHGEDIRYWYYRENYCMSTIRGYGTLGKSCMMGG